MFGLCSSRARFTVRDTKGRREISRKRQIAFATKSTAISGVSSRANSRRLPRSVEEIEKICKIFNLSCQRGQRPGWPLRNPSPSSSPRLRAHSAHAPCIDRVRRASLANAPHASRSSVRRPSRDARRLRTRHTVPKFPRLAA